MCARVAGLLLAISLIVPACRLSAQTTGAQQPRQLLVIQAIEDARVETSLHTSPDGDRPHTWWVTDKAIDPAAYSSRYLARPHARDSAEPGWHAVTVPSSVYKTVPHFKNRGKEYYQALPVVWYRKSFRLPAKFTGSLSVRLGLITDSDRVYLNGRYVGGYGDFTSGKPQAYDRLRIYELDTEALNKGGLNVLLVQVKPHFYEDVGIYRDRVSIGPTALLNRTFYITNMVQMCLNVCYLTVGLYFMFLFLRRRRERENMFFGLFTVCLVTYFFLRNQLKHEAFSDFYVMKGVEYVTLFLMVPLFFFFTRYLFGLPKNRFVQVFDVLTYVATAILVGLSVYIFIDGDVRHWNVWNKFIVQRGCWPPLMFGIFGILIYQMIKKNKDAFIIMGGFVVLMVGVMNDIIVENGGAGFIGGNRRLGDFTFVVYILSLAAILANRFVRVHEDVEDLNKNLEIKVEDRTEQLRKTLRDVQALKVQQDGDYFLTSLLINPLGGNFVRSETLNVTTLARQKKEFQFKERNYEIGGDLNIAFSIKLKGKPYTVFLNADAMGKSMQGAGGALVLGTVFKSVITRTQMSRAAQDVYPEQWMKACFIELQNTFVSFDGSMLISVAMGLVDDGTGVLYYINAEHPWAVLYRAGRATFMENDLLMRKIGIDGLAGSFSLQVFQLEADDVVIVGSDGRDDVLTGYEGDQRIINEDESEFLRHVEAGGGRLDQIEASIRAHGELTDDFSLIRIGYREDMPAQAVEPTGGPAHREILAGARKAYKARDYGRAIEQYEQALAEEPSSIPALRELGQVLIKSKQYERAARTLEEYLELNPFDTEGLYLASAALKHCKDYGRALDYGERCRLRQPGHITNLINLADVYRLAGKDERARMIVDQALGADPGNERAERIRRLLARAG